MARKYTHAQKITALRHIADGKSRKEAATLAGYSLQAIHLEMPQLQLQVNSHYLASDKDVVTLYLRDNGLAA